MNSPRREPVASAPVVETVSRRRIVPPEELQKEEKTNQVEMPDLWEYMELLGQQDWTNHVLYIYRLEPRLIPTTGEPAYIDRTYDGCIQMPNGQMAPVSSEVIKDKFGGRLFRLILKRGREIITVAKLATEAAPKYPEAASISNPPNNPGTDASAAAAIGSEAIKALSGQESAAINVAVNALKAASDVISSMIKPQQPAPGSVEKQLMQAALTRLLNPPKEPDMLTMFGQLKTLFAPTAAPTNTVKEVVETISALKNAGLIPSGDGSQRTNMGIELARQIPSVTNALKDSVHEWRMGVESQERTAAISRGAAPPVTAPANYIAPSAAQPNPTILTNAAAPAAAQPPGNEEVSLDPPLEWIEHKIVDILKENLSVADTADETLAFLSRACPAMIPELLTAGERMVAAGMIPASATPGAAGILHLFQTRPILMQVPVNPRLVEFIKTFIEYASKPQSESPPSTKPN